MPVQFIGSSGGGSTGDVRDTFNDLVLNDVLVNSTSIIVSQLIPANYLKQNNMVSLKHIGIYANYNGVNNMQVSVRVGNTGTTSDPILITSDTLIASSTISSFLFRHEIAFPSVGTSGTCVTWGKLVHLASAAGGCKAISNFTPTTVDTTLPVYITISATTTGTPLTYDTLGAYISIGH